MQIFKSLAMDLLFPCFPLSLLHWKVGIYNRNAVARKNIFVFQCTCTCTPQTKVPESAARPLLPPWPFPPLPHSSTPRPNIPSSQRRFWSLLEVWRWVPGGCIWNLQAQWDDCFSFTFSLILFFGKWRGGKGCQSLPKIPFTSSWPDSWRWRRSPWWPAGMTWSQDWQRLRAAIGV